MFSMKIFILIGFVSYISADKADGINEFSLEFSQAAFKNYYGNAVSSPLSTFLILMSITYGAKGETAVELTKILRFYSDQYPLNTADIQSIMQSLEGLTQVKFKIANKIYISDEFIVNPDFKEIIKRVFGLEIEHINFKNMRKSAQTINDWYYANTEKKIQSIIHPANINFNTKMLLINSVYFMGTWQNVFPDTRADYFHLESGEEQLVTMMELKNFIFHGTLNDNPATFVELPYRSFNTSDAMNLYIILPDEGKTLADIDLTKIKLADLKSGHAEHVFLSFPKFSIESRFSPKSMLQMMGLKTLFEGSADLTGISVTGLHVDSIIQKSFFSVDELGTEAASGSIADMQNKFGLFLAPYDIKRITINRPFYAIVANSRVISFVARVTNIPNASINLQPISLLIYIIIFSIINI